MQKTDLPRHVVQLTFLVLLVASLILAVSNELAWFFLLVLLLFLILLLWWLFGGRQPAAPPPVKYPPEEFYVQGQIIIRGPEAAVDQAVAAVPLELMHNSETDRIRFNALSGQLGQCFDGYPGIDFDTFIIARYTFDGTQTEVAAAIELINYAVGRGSDVRAEPNWLSGHQWETSGFGWEPWEPTGSGEGGGHPVDDADYFLKQWAFKHIGLPNMEEHRCGAGVRIGIFDTWPSDNQGLAVAAQSLSWVNKPSPLTIMPPINASYVLPEEKQAPNLSSHGLFTAGLAHAVAPEAEIQIYRVLNKQNKGDLFSLIQALFDFIKGVAPRHVEGESLPLGAVINLSLGIRVPPGEAKMNLPLEVQALRDILRVARCAGIVIVAASGNSSASSTKAKPADLPANWSEIIGVASSNKADDRSCFSNRGDLAAPGGDGGKRDEGGSACIPLNDRCDSPDCEYAVIGPVFRGEDGSESYAFWSGTSFATPMVAGLAACVIVRGEGQLTPDQVRCIIECGATKRGDDLGKGIINFAKTLGEFEHCLAESGISVERPNYQNVKQAVVVTAAL